QGIHEIEDRRRLHMIETIPGRADPRITEPCSFRQRLLPAPRLDDDVFVKAAVEDFVPANHSLAVCSHDGLQAPVEICLERAIVFDAVLAHESLDAWITVPLLAVHLVAADVEVLIRK